MLTRKYAPTTPTSAIVGRPPGVVHMLGGGIGFVMSIMVENRSDRFIDANPELVEKNKSASLERRLFKVGKNANPRQEILQIIASVGRFSLRYSRCAYANMKRFIRKRRLPPASWVSVSTAERRSCSVFVCSSRLSGASRHNALCAFLTSQPW